MNTSISQKEIANKFSVGEDVISNINHGKSRRLENYNYPLRDNSRQIKYCLDCGVELKSSKTIRCMNCTKKSIRVVERPSREELKSLIRDKSFVEIGKRYNVSDNTIRKWCDYYNLPRRKSEIKKFSNENWNLL